MNRLVLIGNGFDLAHDLKTRYENFINWYWENWGVRLLHGMNRTETDGLCIFKIKDGIEVSNWAYAFGWYYQRNNPLIPWDPNVVVQIAKEDSQFCNFAMSPFLERITKSIKTKGWVDIENEYYSLLFQEKMDIKKGFIEPDYKSINNQLDILREELIQYLKQLENIKIHYIDEIEEKIYRPIKERELAVSYKRRGAGRSKEELNPARVLLLNFNYTKTPTLYTQKHSHVSINYIHGCLDSPESIIFGYGDELDDGFKKLKDKNNNECLRHMKSIHYLESDNYRKMLEFIESAPFQVCIMGHSCGNSDRTLLNTLFEHRNCVSVKPYYYIKGQEDNYLELVQNISRNFTDMKLMRDRVVNKEYCEPLTIK